MQSIAALDRRPTLLFAGIASLTLAVAQAGFAQTQIQPNRITPSGSTSASGRPAGPNAPSTAAGRGAALGDGTRMGGQTFQWSRSGGAGMALGGGNRLDSNTQVGAGRSNSPSTPVDYNSRNLVVTGNVAGGRGFRGSVGYTADTDFRGKAGSDATFKFEADSAYSNVAFSSSSLSRDRFLVAQGLGAFEYRRESTPIGIQAQRIAVDQPDSRLRLDRANTAMALGRLNYEVGEDRVVATGTGVGGEPIRYIVSPLRGLQMERLNDPVVRSGLSLYEQARARQEIAEGLAKPEDFSPRSRAVERGMMDTQVKPTDVGELSRVQTQLFSQGYLDILKSVDSAAAKKTGDESATLDRVKRDLDELSTPRVPGTTDFKTREAEREQREKEAAAERPSGTVPPGESVRPDVVKPQQPGGKDDPLLKPTDLESEREEDREKVRGKLMTVDQMAEVLRHGKTIATLSREDKRRVDELVRLGEASLKAGDYFAAERRFLQAQDYRSGDPLIEVGMAHAQLGGGLYLSASLSLRNLFKAHPELIDATYDRALLPAPARLESSLAMIRERLAAGEDQANYGFLLAYIGHQTGDKALVEEGLGVVKGNESLDTYGALLRGIWLGGK
jgi:hypothetical protein